MPREDIIGILKVALQKGKNLQQTIQSLCNSGYSKDEVDEAVKVLNMRAFQPVFIIPPQKPKPIQQPKEQAPQGQTQQIVSAYPYPVQQPIFYQPQPQQFFQATQPMQFYQPQPYQPSLQQFVQSPQIVSGYEQAKKPRVGKLITIIMVAMLVVLLGILVAVFLFKDELTTFINNL